MAVNLKRWTVCLVRGHRWSRVRYEPEVDDTGFFLRCRLCGHENHEPQEYHPIWAG